MEAYQEQLIDIALNVLGYLAGGAFWLVVYSAWRNRIARAHEREVGASAAQSPVTPAVSGALAAAAADAEFLDLRSVPAVTNAANPGGRRPVAAAGVRRNHREVFALARTMLEKGASTDAVKAAVPISDGELALLTGK
ncbi:MAG: hypothetical protein RBT76_00895 [candidate division Zixibacteria bacterium]|jgi:hypothetical protein|nr:hypothetical protein [candidate division Zixibacteria bacterium]